MSQTLTQSTTKHNYVQLALCILGVVAVGALSSVFTVQSINTWYPQLNKPDWNPPNELFGPVWTFLYILIGVGLYIILRSKHSFYRSTGIVLFAIQLVLNFFWSIIFFYWHQMGLALVEIILMLGTILVMMYNFSKINSTAAVLQVPYVLWVSFATVLNAVLWWMNK
jgi:translocator protein